MPRPKHHVFVCHQQRPPGHPRGSCAASGAPAVLQAFRAEQQHLGAADVSITHSGCVGPCAGGPNVLVYPDGVLYQGVQPGDVIEIFERHLVGGEPVSRLLAASGVW